MEENSHVSISHEATAAWIRKSQDDSVPLMLRLIDMGIGAATVRRLQHVEDNGLTRWDQRNPEVFYDAKRMGSFATSGGFSRPEVGDLVRETFMRTGMRMQTGAFELNEGYLALGTFVPGDFYARSRPTTLRSLKDAERESMNTVSAASTLIVSTPAAIDVVMKSMPWLRDAAVANGWQSSDVIMILDIEHNATLMRKVTHAEIRARLPEFPILNLTTDDSDQYYIPFAIIAPSIKYTMFTDLSLKDIKPDTMTPVVWAHHYEAFDAATSVSDRDGDFNLQKFYLYEDCLKNGSHERLPTVMGFYNYFYTFTPRWDLHKEIIMDMEWITFHDSLTTDGHNRFLSPQVAQANDLVRFDLGLYAELDELTNSWMHSLIDVSYYTKTERITHVLELSSKLTSATQRKSFTSGKKVCRVDRASGNLQVLEITRGDELMHEIRAKIMDTLPTTILATHISHANMWGDGEAWVPNLGHVLKYGLYPPSMDVSWKELPDSASICECGGNVDQVKTRAYQVYAADRAYLLDTARDRLTVERFDKEADNLHVFAETFMLDPWQSKDHQEREQKRRGKLVAMPCKPRVLEALDAWNRILEKERSGKAVVKPDSFREWLERERDRYAPNCTMKEWIDAVEQHVVAHEQKKKEEQRAAGKAKQKQDERQKKLDEKMERMRLAEAQADEARRATAAAAAADARADEERRAAAAAAEAVAEAAAAQAAGFGDDLLGYREELAGQAREAEARAVQVRYEEERARSARLIEEGKRAKEAAAADAKARQEETRRKKQEAAEAQKKNSKKSTQAQKLVARHQENLAQGERERQAAEERDAAAAAQGGGRNRRRRGEGAPSGEDAARAAFEANPRGRRGR